MSEEDARIPDAAELLDLVQDAVFVVDAIGRLLYVSAGCQCLLGYRPEELIGSYMIEHVHPDDRGTTLNRVWRIMWGVSGSRFRNRAMHKDGHAVQIEWVSIWSEKHRVRVATARAVESPEAASETGPIAP